MKFNRGALQFEQKIEKISVQRIVFGAYQPRTSYDNESMQGLVQSIRKNGIIQPLGVRRVAKQRYELIFGHRRFMAAKMLNMPTVPCVVADICDQNALAFAVIENIQRENLSFLEEARAIRRLIDEFRLTQCEISLKLGISQPQVANKLRLLKLTDKQLERIENFSLTERHARALLRISDDRERDNALNEIVVRGFNVEQTDRFIDRLLAPQSGNQNEINKLVVKDIRLFVNSINKAIKVMKNSGVNAKSERNEDENFIRYTVTIPKKTV